jgi:FkbM family methyltransferase
MLNIASVLPPLPPIRIVDVGAMSIGEGHDPYAMLMKALPCEVIGFEPVVAECEKLDRMGHAGRTYLPYFIGDGATHTFHECNFPMTSSLFEPNALLLAKFQNLENLVQVVKVYPAETKRLDDIAETAGVDLLKLDVQGAELMVLQGTAERLKSALVVADIDAHLRSKGFLLHQIGFTGRTFKPVVFKNDINAMLSQWLWGDAVYVPDFMRFDALPPAALLKLAAILHENYRSFDLAAVALTAYDRVSGSRTREKPPARCAPLTTIRTGGCILAMGTPGPRAKPTQCFVYDRIARPGALIGSAQEGKQVGACRGP